MTSRTNNRSWLRRVLLALCGIAVVTLAVLHPVATVAQSDHPWTEGTPEQAAKDSLQMLKKLVTPQIYRPLGFHSMDEVREAELGRPLHVYMVPLNQLRRYNADIDPRKLLFDTHEVLFPVVFGSRVRSGVFVWEHNDAWQVVTYGRPRTTRAVADVREQWARTREANLASFIVVGIPALNLYFVARRSEKELWLAPAFDDARFKLQAAHPVLARSVFRDIGRYAAGMKLGPHLVR